MYQSPPTPTRSLVSALIEQARAAELASETIDMNTPGPHVQPTANAVLVVYFEKVNDRNDTSEDALFARVSEGQEEELDMFASMENGDHVLAGSCHSAPSSRRPSSTQKMSRRRKKTFTRQAVATTMSNAKMPEQFAAIVISIANDDPNIRPLQRGQSILLFDTLRAVLPGTKSLSRGILSSIWLRREIERSCPGNFLISRGFRCTNLVRPVSFGSTRINLPNLAAHLPLQQKLQLSFEPSAFPGVTLRLRRSNGRHNGCIIHPTNMFITGNANTAGTARRIARLIMRLNEACDQGSDQQSQTLFTTHQESVCTYRRILRGGQTPRVAEGLIDEQTSAIMKKNEIDMGALEMYLNSLREDAATDTGQNG